MTKKKDSINPREFQVGSIKISENGKENETATIYLEIPFDFSFCGRRDVEEYRYLALEEMRLKASTLFKIVEYFGAEMASGGYDGAIFADQISVCAELGQSLMQVQDLIHLSFDSHKTQPTNKEEKPRFVQSDNLETENTALLISNLLNNPNVPQKIRDGLNNALDDTHGVDTSEINAFWKSPEYIAMVLRGYEQAEVK